MPDTAVMKLRRNPGTAIALVLAAHPIESLAIAVGVAVAAAVSAVSAASAAGVDGGGAGVGTRTVDRGRSSGPRRRTTGP